MDLRVTSSPQPEIELSPVPRRKLSGLLATQGELYRVFSAVMGEQLLPHRIPGLVQRITLVIGWGGSPDTITETLRQFGGRVMDHKLARQLSFVFSAREDELHGGPIVVLENPQVSEWVAVEVQAVEEVGFQTKTGTKPGVEFTMLIMTGHSAGQIVCRKFPLSWLGYLAYQVAFSRRIRYDYNPKHFLGLRFWGFVEQKGDQEWRFLDVAIGPRPKNPESKVKPGGELLKHNRAIVKLRTRFEFHKAECPHDYTHECFDCPVEKRDCQASVRCGDSQH
jgi:hypothetical protein